MTTFRNLADQNYWSPPSNKSWVPRSIGGMIFWMRADKGITLSGGVSQALDQSGRANSVSQAVAGQRPAYSAADSTANQRATMTCTRTSSQKLVGAVGIAGLFTTSLTMACVVKLAATNVAAAPIAAGRYASTGCQLYCNGSARSFGCGGVGDNTFGTPTTSWEIWIVRCVRGSTPVATVNGAAQTVTVGGTSWTALDASSAIVLGGIYNSTAADFGGSVAEAFIWNVDIGATAATALARYLGRRYSITTV